MAGKTISHYQILEKIGAGGMGVVYKARDTHLDRLVAIKVLPPERVADPSRKARFVQEAKAASALNHPNIIHIYDISSDSGVDFIAMEYVAGKTLDQLISRKGMKLREALKIAIQVADALARAHKAGLIHRDVKPSNIMVDEHGSVRMLDFGLAKLTERGHPDDETRTLGVMTEQGAIVGTPAYMSPEQANGEAVDARSDVFSFGAVLYEMVTGRKAFQGKSTASILTAVLHHEPMPVEGMPQELEKILVRCLRKDRERRIRHMDDVKLMLEEVRDDTGAASAAVSAVAVRSRRLSWLWAAAAVPVMATRVRWAAILAPALLVLGGGVLWWVLSQRQTAPAEQRHARMTFDSGATISVTASRDGHLMAYASDRAGEGHMDIWLQWVDPALGRQPIRLTNHPAHDYSPCLSPDGSRVVFGSTRDGGGIYLLDTLAGEPAGGRARKLVEHGRYPRFSPDGKRIAYVQYSASGLPLTNRMYVIPADGGAAQALHTELGIATPPGMFGPLWSPDGKHLLFVGTKAGNPPVWDWWVAPVDGGSPIGLQFRKAVPETGMAQIPALWASDSIVFARGSSVEGYNLFSVPIDEKTWTLGQPFRQVTSGPGMRTSAALLPGGQMLIDNTVATVQVTAVPFQAGAATVAGEQRLLTRDAAQKFTASVSIDGSTLVLNPVGGLERPQRHLRVLNLISGSENLIPQIGSRAIVTPHLSADGSLVAYTGNVGSKTAGIVVSPDGSGSRQICEDCSVVDVFPGGKSVLVLSGGKCVKLDLASGERTVVFSVPPLRVRDTRISDDARWLAVLLDQPDGGNTIFMVPLESLPVAADHWIPVVTGPGWVSAPRLTPGARWLLYYSERDGLRSVWAQRFDPTARKPVGEAHEVLHRPAGYFMDLPRFEYFLEISRDKLFVPLERSTGNIWMTQTDLRQ